jgi:hypothetical protein
MVRSRGRAAYMKKTPFHVDEAAKITYVHESFSLSVCLFFFFFFFKNEESGEYEKQLKYIYNLEEDEQV